ncbi:MAG: phosphate--AMP phosphotransferase [Armatimonadia bacterium]|nr:phosphate--AMP phosphotransferase [Armatimonadia bacterium]
MLEKVDLSQALAKSAYKEASDELEIRLGAAQRRARELGLRTVVLLEGWDASGKGEVISELAASWDPRGFDVHVFKAPTDEERLFPFQARFWRRLPPAGGIGIFNRSWYRRVLDERVEARISEDQWREAFDEIIRLERQLITDGYLVLKYFLHIDKKEQKRRFKAVSEDPVFAWKVGPEERRRRRKRDAYHEATEEMLARTSTGLAPWEIIPATCLRHARIAVAQSVLAAMGRACDELHRAPDPAPDDSSQEEPEQWIRPANPLDRVDLSKTLDDDDYDRQLDDLQEDLLRLQHRVYQARVPVVIVYEGWDAAGKGGSIRRLTRELDPRGYEVIPIGAPTPQELSHHYLRRFWIRVPKAGHIGIFDRSWYGRVLVERVEGFCAEAEWRRAYQEINEFEASLARFGAVIAKFWIHISPEEQLRRFEARQNTPHKRWKITEDDWRNREKWDQYYAAVGEMVQRTSTSYAPWTILEGDSKKWARVRALRTVKEAIEAALG